MPNAWNPERYHLSRRQARKIRIPVEERNAIIEASRKFGVGACYLVSIIKRNYVIKTNHVRVYRVLKEEAMLCNTATAALQAKMDQIREGAFELWVDVGL